MKAVQAKAPCPDWQVFKGHKMSVLFNRQSCLRISNGNVAYLEIKPIPAEPRRARTWEVSWGLMHDCGKVEGYIHMTDEELRRAFGLEDGLGVFGKALADRTSTKVDAAEQGKFVRAGKWLNIPHPGTGLQGDPNISIEVDGYMRLAILELLKEKVAT